MRAAVTGIGAVTAFGRGTARLWDAMAAGEQGIRRIVGGQAIGQLPDIRHVVEVRVGLHDELRAEAERAWGAKYSLYRFHALVMTHGRGIFPDRLIGRVDSAVRSASDDCQINSQIAMSCCLPLTVSRSIC